MTAYSLWRMKLNRIVASGPGGLPFVQDDGGRAAAGFQGTAGDCVVRAIAIASGLPYQQVYDSLHATMKDAKRAGDRSPRNGVPKPLSREFMKWLGWQWTPTMLIGQGCKVHLRPGELPNGRLVVAVSRHLVAVIDGVIHDTSDCSRNGTRCVYGYWRKP